MNTYIYKISGDNFEASGEVDADDTNKAKEFIIRLYLERQNKKIEVKEIKLKT